MPNAFDALLLSDAPTAGQAAPKSAFDALLEDGPAAPAVPPAPAVTAKPVAQIPGADEPYTPRASAPPPEPIGVGEQLLGGTADAVDFIFAGIPSMVVAAAGDTVTRTQTALNSALGLSTPKSRREVGKAGNETAARITQSFGTPARTLLQSMGLISDRPLAIGKAMEAVSSFIDSAGAEVEARTGGAVQKEDVITGVNLIFGAAGAKGVKIAADAPAKMAKARDAVKALRDLQAEGELRAFDALKPEPPKPGDAPFRQRNPAAADPNVAAFDRRASAERRAYELMRDGAPQRKVDAIVKQNPEVGAAMDRIAERRTAAAVFAEDAAPAPLRPEVAALRRPSEMGATEFAARDAAAGVARGPLGEPVASANPQARPMPRRSIARGRPMTDSGLMGVAAKPIKRDALGTPLSGPDVAAVAGATGLGLAAYFAAQGDTDEATALAMSGALLVGRGRGQGLTLEALRTAPDNAPLSALRDADLVTLNTLENLPGNRSSFSKQSVAELLKRAEVTKAERDVIQPVLDAAPGDTISAKALMTGVKERTGPRAQQFGSADPKLMAAITAVGGGAALGALLDEERPGRGGTLGGLAGAVLSLGLFAKSHSPGIAEMAQSAGRGVEYALGAVSTRMGQMSPAFLRRMREHERGVLTRTNAYLKEISPFVERLRELPQDLQDRLGAAMLTGDSAKVVATLGAAKAVGLLPEWRKARNLLDAVGRELMAAGKLKGMLPDYYPRVVIDAPGLIKALGGEQRTYVERLLKEANDKAMASAGRELSPLETSALINKALKQRPGDGRPGFLKQRSVEEVDARLLPFYAPASESLPLYLRAVGKELERARFFGDNLVRDADTGLANIDQSIGNLVRQEWQAKRITAEQMDELADILRSRFGPGERATARPLQAAKDLAYAGLLGHVTSALTQSGDLLISAYAHGVLPTLKALQQQVTNRQARATVADLGMVDHMAEEITGATRTPVTVLGRQLSTAKFLQTVFRYSGFSAVDQLGKNVSIQASRNKLTSWARSPAGVKKLEAKYGKAYPGEELAALVGDLRSGVLTDRVKGVLFSELSDVQPISRIEVPQAYLDMPNGRVLYMLKTFMLKQMDIARRDVVGQFRAGRIAQGTQNGLRLSLALGIGGAGTSLINDWLLGRDSDADWGDVPLNALKTFGWSTYTIDKVKQGKPLEAAADVVAPPYKMFDAIIAQDPRAIQYLPVIGRLMYAHNWGDLLDESGAEKYNRKLELQRNRED